MEEFADDSSEMSYEITLPPCKQKGWVVEIKASMAKGGVLGYEYTAAERVSFNIHSHHGKEVNYHIKTEAEVSAGVFNAPADHDYYVMWENKLPRAVNLKFKLFRN